MMTATATTASIVLTAQDKTRAAFQSASKNLEGLGAVAGKVNLAMTSALGAGLGLGTFTAWIKGISDSADALKHLADRVGTNVESLARYEQAAKLADTTLEGLGASLGKLSIFMAQNANEAARLGITARDPVEAFAQLADVVARVEDPARRNALAMRVLGRSYEEVMPLLKQGGDALREQTAAAGPYARKMAELSEEAGKLNDTFNTMAQRARELGASLAGPLVSGLNKALAATKEMLDTSDSARALDLQKRRFELELQIAKIRERSGSADFKETRVNFLREEVNKLNAELDQVLGRGKIKLPGREALAAAAAADRAAVDIELGKLLPDSGAERLQATLRKAFDPAPLDDFLSKFKDRREKINAEFARLKADLTGPDTTQESDTATLDLSYELTKGRGALASGDAVGAGIAAERAKAMLTTNRDQLGAGISGYFAEQIRAYELAMVDAEEKTALAAVDVMKRNMDAAAAEIATMEPVHIPLAVDAFTADLRSGIEAMRRELAAKPFDVPVRLIGAPGQAGNIADAALKLGAR